MIVIRIRGRIAKAARRAETAICAIALVAPGAVAVMLSVIVILLGIAMSEGDTLMFGFLACAGGGFGLAHAVHMLMNEAKEAASFIRSRR